MKVRHTPSGRFENSEVGGQKWKVQSAQHPITYLALWLAAKVSRWSLQVMTEGNVNSLSLTIIWPWRRTLHAVIPWLISLYRFCEALRSTDITEQTASWQMKWLICSDDAPVDEAATILWRQVTFHFHIIHSLIEGDQTSYWEILICFKQKDEDSKPQMLRNSLRRSTFFQKSEGHLNWRSHSYESWSFQ